MQTQSVSLIAANTLSHSIDGEIQVPEGVSDPMYGQASITKEQHISDNAINVAESFNQKVTRFTSLQPNAASVAWVAFH